MYFEQAITAVGILEAAGTTHPVFTRERWEQSGSTKSYAYWLLDNLHGLDTSETSGLLKPWDFKNQYLGKGSYQKNMAQLEEQLSQLNFENVLFTPETQEVLTPKGMRHWNVEILAAQDRVESGLAVSAVKYQWYLLDKDLELKPSMVLLQALLANGIRALETHTLDPDEYFIGALNGELGVFYKFGVDNAYIHNLRYEKYNQYDLEAFKKEVVGTVVLKGVLPNTEVFSEVFMLSGQEDPVHGAIDAMAFAPLSKLATVDTFGTTDSAFYDWTAPFEALVLERVLNSYREAA